MDSQPPGDPGVNISPFLTKFPNEIIDKILMKVEDAAKLREIRLLSRACAKGATRALFSHLDVSLDEIGCMKLDCIAQSPTLRRMVKSIRFCEPRIVFSTRWVRGTTVQTHRQNNYGYMQAADGSDSGLIAKLARALRLLPEVGKIEIDCRLGAQHDHDEDLDGRYKLWALSALESLTLPKLKMIIISHRKWSFIQEWYETDADRLDRLISRASKFIYVFSVDFPQVRVVFHFDQGWRRASEPQDPSSSEESIWPTLTGYKISGWRERVPPRPALMICEKIDSLSTIEPENMFTWNGLVSVTLDTFATSLLRLIQAIFPGPESKLHTVRLRRIHIYEGSFEDLFTKLSGCESLVELELMSLMYLDDCLEHIRRQDYNQLPWLPERDESWNMVLSRNFRDLSACRDLLHQVDRNRTARGLPAKFPDTKPLSENMSQAEWLAKLSPLNECSRAGRFEWDMEWDRKDPFSKVPWFRFPLQDGIMHYFLKLRTEQELLGLHDQIMETTSKWPPDLRRQACDRILPTCTEMTDGSFTGPHD